MWRGLSQALEDAGRDSRTRFIILRGKGGAFSAGDDIAQMLALQTVEEVRDFFRVVGRAFQRLLTCRKPVIAVVEGPAVGGGAELLLASDIVIASRNSVIGFPESRLGLLAPILTTLGVYVLGYRRAKALAISGAMLAPEEARDLGIVDLIADPGVVDKVLEETLAMLRRTPPHAVWAAKEIVMASIRPALEAALAELELLVLSREAKERMRRFLEK